MPGRAKKATGRSKVATKSVMSRQKFCDFLSQLCCDIVWLRQEQSRGRTYVATKNFMSRQGWVLGRDLCCDRKSFYVASGNLVKEKFLVVTEFLGRGQEGCRKWKKWRKVGRDLKF